MRCPAAALAHEASESESALDGDNPESPSPATQAAAVNMSEAAYRRDSAISRAGLRKECFSLR